MRIPKFIGNLLSVYSANAINGVLGIISVPVIVTLLGNKQYGVFSIYSVLASYVALVDFGVTKHFIGLMASNRDKEKQSAYLQKAFGWYLGLSAILISALPLLIYIVTEYLSFTRFVINFTSMDCHIFGNRVFPRDSHHDNPGIHVVQ